MRVKVNRKLSTTYFVVLFQPREFLSRVRRRGAVRSSDEGVNSGTMDQQSNSTAAITLICLGAGKNIGCK